jgi:hypothetical protein
MVEDRIVGLCRSMSFRIDYSNASGRSRRSAVQRHFPAVLRVRRTHEVHDVTGKSRKNLQLCKTSCLIVRIENIGCQRLPGVNMRLYEVLFLVSSVAAQACLYPMCPPFDGATNCNINGTIGTTPQDFSIIGPPLQAVHESVQAPTGLAVDNDLNIYLTYPRNSGATKYNVVIATNFTGEEPWPSSSIQNCSTGQNASTCFINVQNVVLDSQGVMWIVDSGIPYTTPGGMAVSGGSKIMSFNISTKELMFVSTILLGVEGSHS